MNENDRRSVFAYCSERKLAAGDVLFDYGEEGNNLYFIEGGRLAVHKFTGFQQKMQVVALLDKGSLAGESVVLGAHLHKTKVTATEEATLLSLSKEEYQRLLSEQPELALRFLSYLISIVTLRLEKTSERLAQIL